MFCSILFKSLVNELCVLFFELKSLSIRFEISFACGVFIFDNSCFNCVKIFCILFGRLLVFKVSLSFDSKNTPDFPSCSFKIFSSKLLIFTKKFFITDSNFANFGSSLIAV